MFFWLAPPFLGCGFGGVLLGHAVRSAWEWHGTERLWVHTCTLDYPAHLETIKRVDFVFSNRRTRSKADDRHELKLHPVKGYFGDDSGHGGSETEKM